MIGLDKVAASLNMAIDGDLMGLDKAKKNPAEVNSKEEKGPYKQESSCETKVAQETGLARRGAKLIKGPAKVNEVMKAAPREKRDDILRALRNSKK